MSEALVTNLIWLFLAGTLCLLSAYWLKRVALNLLARAFGPGFALGLYALLTLPGFFLHEGAHALTALLLRVPIRGVTFIPRPSPDDLSISAGVQVAPADPLRMAFIAIAPLLTGTVVVGLVSGALGTAGLDPRPWVRMQEWVTVLDQAGLNRWTAVYLIWSISGHMAPSPIDMRHMQHGAAILLALLLLTGLIIPLLGATVPDQVGITLGRLSDGLSVAAVLNGAILLPLSITTYLLRRK